MPRKKKSKLPESVSTTMKGVFHPEKVEKMTELPTNSDLTVTREEFNQVVAKVNELVRKAN